MGKAKSSSIYKKQNRVNQAILAALMFSCGSVLWNPTACAETLTITTDQPGPVAPTTALSDNTVTIGSSDSTPNLNSNSVYGGFNQVWTAAAVSHNTVSILSGINIFLVDGGRAYGDAEIYNNTITVQGGTIGGLVGGVSDAGGKVHDNTVDIAGGTVQSSVYGGESFSGEVYNNSVAVRGGTVDGYISGAWSNDGEVHNNQVNIILGNVKDVWGGNSYNGNVDNNTVNITDGTINTSGWGVYGGYSSNNGNVDNNTVNITGGTINGTVWGGVSTNGNVDNNTVNITSGTINGTGWGLWGGVSSYGKTSNNIVNITGGTIKGYIGGGLNFYGTEVKGNVVIINPQNDLDISQATLYGGYLYTNHANNVLANNVLKVYGKNIVAKNLYNFSDLYFYLPTDIKNQDTVLTLQDTNKTNISHSSVKAGIVGNANVFVGDKINLLHNDQGIISTGTTYGNLTEGVSVDYALEIAPDAAEKNIVATVTKGSLNPQTKSLTETRAGSMAFLNSGITMLSDVGIKNAINAAIGRNMVEPFVAMGNSSMRYNTGSYVDNNGNNFNLGFARTLDRKNYQLTIGAFLEGGWATYDSYLDSGIHGSGNMNYYGLGLLAHRANRNGVYYEGSLHYGYIDSEYKSNELAGSSDERYKLSTPYYGLHVGVGKVITVNSEKTLDIYSKYYYSCQNGNTTTLTSGEFYDFSSTTSNRIKIGMRYIHSYNENKKVYVGAAYEYELSGSANAAYKGYNTLSPSLKGGSGMLEVGYKIKPNKKSPLTLDIALSGWIGRQQGINTNMGVSWNF